MLLLSGTTAFAKTNVLRLDGLFAVDYDNESDTQVCAMQLKAGQVLDINANIVSGAVAIAIRRNFGDLLYDHEAGMTFNDTLVIPADDIYRISVDIKNAKGNLRISAQSGAPAPTVDVPFERQFIKGSFGYGLEYDPAKLDFTAGSDMDVFAERVPDMDQQIVIWLHTENASLDSMTIGLMADNPQLLDSFTTEMLDWRVARTIRLITNADGSHVGRYTIIENGLNKSFVFMATYPLAREAEAEALIGPMLHSLRFTE